MKCPRKLYASAMDDHVHGLNLTVCSFIANKLSLTCIFSILQIGTYSISMAALELKKSVYVLTESFKFSRIYPLNQQDLPKEFKYLSSVLKSDKDLSKQHPIVDYTPPSFISLLFTDIGILTPAAVSDELMKLYT